MESIAVLQKRSLREQIRDWILQAIGSGELSPDDRIMENHLSARLGVSPIPVREAIRELISIGVLDSVPHKGAWVKRVDPSETIEALEVRAAIEPLALRLAGPDLAGRLPELREIARQIVAAAAKHDWRAFQEQNQLFHRGIVQACGNRVLLRVWDSLTYAVGAQSVLHSIPSLNAVAVAKEHVEVLAAAARGDIERAANLLAGHTNRLAERLRNEHPGPQAVPAKQAQPPRSRRPGKSTA